ncbi:MAG: DUF5683 domain-containing protein [Balneolaceae bacterium]
MLLIISASHLQAQQTTLHPPQNVILLEQRLETGDGSFDAASIFHRGVQGGLSPVQQQDSVNTEYPSPKSVLMKSVILPGWGQVENRQVWKVPIIYGLFGGLVYYTVSLTQDYHDYRAAFYNRSRGEDTDFRFGQTPGHIPESISLNELRDRRNNYRNQRDMSYIYIALAYGLNIVDAYVYAHMRSFDVSDDLSAQARISPGITHEATPGIRVRIQLQPKQHQ